MYSLKNFETPEKILDVLRSFGEFSPDIDEEPCEYCNFETYEEALEYAKEIGEHFDSFDDILDIYRVIGVEYARDIDWVCLGSHWTYHKDSIKDIIRNLGIGETLILFHGKIKKDNINWKDTIKNYHRFSQSYTDSDENEITLDDCGHIDDFEKCTAKIFTRIEGKFVWKDLDWNSETF